MSQEAFCEKAKFDIHDEHNIVMQNTYETDNYKVIECNPKIRRCFIFFSSNGLYYPNTKEEFERFVVKDKYEWQRIASLSCVKEKVGRIIFVRDIYKQWYVKGINKEVNTQEKVIGLLRELSKGYEVTTIGNSAGGFMATLVGEAIQATHCLSFSGQFHLGNANGKFMDLYMGESEKDKILYRIKQSNVPIYFFYSNRNQSDVFQYDQVKECSNVRSFSFKSNIHGYTMLSINLPRIILCKKDYLDRLYTFWHGKEIDKYVFYLFSGGWKTNVVMFVDKILDKSRYKSGKKKSERTCMVDI